MVKFLKSFKTSNYNIIWYCSFTRETTRLHISRTDTVITSLDVTTTNLVDLRMSLCVRLFYFKIWKKSPVRQWLYTKFKAIHECPIFFHEEYTNLTTSPQWFIFMLGAKCSPLYHQQLFTLNLPRLQICSWWICTCLTVCLCDQHG